MKKKKDNKKYIRMDKKEYKSKEGDGKETKM